MELQQDQRIARTALGSNALFSLGTGLLLALAPSTAGGWLGVSIDGWLRILGLALIGHFALLTWATTRPNVRAIGSLNLAAIAPYPFLMVGLVITGLVDRPLGQLLALTDGAIVGGIAILLWVGLRRITSTIQTKAS